LVAGDFPSFNCLANNRQSGIGPWLGVTSASYMLQPVGYGNLLSQRRSSATQFHLFDALGSTGRLVA
jgi:hypothetical protein